MKGYLVWYIEVTLTALIGQHPPLFKKKKKEKKKRTTEKKTGKQQQQYPLFLFTFRGIICR